MSSYPKNPAFGPAQIRELVEIFVEKAVEVRYITLIVYSGSFDLPLASRYMVV